jgi:hypothetical protein
VQQNQLKQQAKTLAEVFQRSSSNVEGRNGYLSLRNPSCLSNSVYLLSQLEDSHGK